MKDTFLIEKKLNILSALYENTDSIEEKRNTKIYYNMLLQDLLKSDSVNKKYYSTKITMEDEPLKIKKIKRLYNANLCKKITEKVIKSFLYENDIELSEQEEKLERMFGPNLNDADYLIEARKIIEKDSMIMNITETLIDKLYKVKDKEIFKKVKEKNENVKVIIATNHLSFVKNFIGKSFNVSYLDDLIISAEIHKIKPNSDFYEYILNKYSIDSKELLFLDDNIDNINAARMLGINTIKVEKTTDLIKEIIKLID